LQETESSMPLLDRTPSGRIRRESGESCYPLFRPIIHFPTSTSTHTPNHTTPHHTTLSPHYRSIKGVPTCHPSSPSLQNVFSSSSALFLSLPSFPLRAAGD
jgi:hypothetical protein